VDQPRLALHVVTCHGKIIWGSAEWVLVVQVFTKCGGVVEALGFEDVGHVAAGEDDDGVGVLTDFGVGLKAPILRLVI
jgi:hypothetical protein